MGRKGGIAGKIGGVLVHEDVAVAGDALLAEEARPEVVEIGAASARLHPEEPRRHLHVPLLLQLPHRLRHRHRRAAPIYLYQRQL